MSDISINMPVIKLPQQRITVQIKDNLGTELGTSEKEGIITYNSLDTLRNQKGGTGKELMCKKDLPPARQIYGRERYQSASKSVTNREITVPDPSTNHQSAPAQYPRNKTVLKEPSTTSFDAPTYYRDPKDMTASQLVKFREKAKFEHMTVEDYQNWLLTYVDTPQRLVGFHRANLKVLIRGGNLHPTDMPISTKLPDNAMDQYSKIIYDSSVDNVPQPEFLGYQPSNYEDQSSQPSLQNRNMRHLDYVNPDEPMKTWTLTRDSKRLGNPGPSWPKDSKNDSYDVI